MSLVLGGLLSSHIQIKQDEATAALLQLDNKDLENTSQTLQTAASAVAIARAGADRESLSELFTLVAEVTPEAIQITERQWQAPNGETPASLSLSGEAADRQSLLNFIAQLESLERAAQVESPIANLIQSRDSKFNIEITLKPYEQ